MNLFVDAHLFDGPGQGTKTYLKGLYGPLVRTRSADKFFMAACDPANVSREFQSSANIQFLTYASSNKYIRLALDVPRIIAKNHIDKAHFQYISPLIKNCFEIVTIHDLLFLDFPEYFPSSYKLSKGFLFKRSARRADVVTTVSDYSKNQLIRHYGIDERKIVITPNGVLDLYDDSSPLINVVKEKYRVENFILYVSRFEPRKNQSGLLKAYVDLELWKKEIQLVFIGSAGVHDVVFDSLYNSLETKIRNQIRILRDIDFEELKAFYQACQLFVYPSFAEGFGIPPLEAAISGATVLCSNTTSMSDFNFFGDALFDPNKPGELLEKISHYINRPVSAAEKQTIIREIKTRYNWEASAHTFWKAIGS